MNTTGENARGLHAIKVLEGKKDFTIESLRAAAYDSYLTAFDDLIPGLVKAYDQVPNGDSLKTAITSQLDLLKGWDKRSGVDSKATTLAIFWAEEFQRKGAEYAGETRISISQMVETDHPEIWLEALKAASQKLTDDFGTWEIAWGDVNRFQRLTGDIVQPFDDNGPSIPVGFTSANWGSLAAYGQTTFNNTKKLYGTRGNSFVAVVEFGDSLKAIAVTAGGQNGNPSNKHFNDQAERYATGQLRPVYFYSDDIKRHAERTYNPGKN